MGTHDLYVEPFSGLAGDMFLAALLDLGDPRFALDDLRELARSLVPGECSIEIETGWRQNLSGKMLTLRTSESERSPHRGIAEIEAIVRGSELSPGVQARAMSVFRRIAVAEGRVHGCAPEEIHFHEVGAVDTIVDVCGAAFALERLGIERVWSSPPVTGTGTVRCAHGEMPVPAPAVAELLRGRVHSISGGGGERLTPTGAALLVELCERFEAPGAFTAERIGWGAGHRDPKDGPPNVVRVQLGRAASSARTATTRRASAWLVETNLDDMTGEELATAAEAVRAAGALDAWMSPVVMKKGRPGVVLSALCRAEKRDEIERAIFDHTTTLGVRWREVERTECARSTLEVDVRGRTIRVKRRERSSDPALDARDLSPEHDDVARVASELGLSTRSVEDEAIRAALERAGADRSDGVRG